MCQEIPNIKSENAPHLEDDDETNQITYYDKYISFDSFCVSLYCSCVKNVAKIQL
jgi:hypothetical protein